MVYEHIKVEYRDDLLRKITDREPLAQLREFAKCYPKRMLDFIRRNFPGEEHKGIRNFYDEEYSAYRKEFTRKRSFFGDTRYGGHQYENQ